MNAKVTELKNKAQKIVKAQSLEILVESFEMTNEKMEAARGNDNEYLAIAETREWIMNELETRNPEAFEKWIDGNEDSPRKFFIGETMKNKRLDVQCAGFLLLDDSDFSSIPLLRFGCEKCKTHDEYCVDCTLKLYEVLNSEKYAEFYSKPEKERHEIFVTQNEATHERICGISPVRQLKQ